MVEIDVLYLGELRCQVTHNPSSSTLLTDAPLDNMGKGQAFSPTDLVGAALGSCILTILGILAQRHSLDLRGTQLRVVKEMVQTPVRRIGRLAVEVTVPTPLTLDQQAMLDRAARTCPVHRSLHPDIQAPIIFHWNTRQ